MTPGLILSPNNAWIFGIALGAGLFGAGWYVGGNLADGRHAREAAVLARQHADAAQAVSDRLVAAQSRADALQNQLAASDQARQSQALEHQREIHRLTRGVPCLNAGTVRLLNSSAGIGQPAAVPEAAGWLTADDDAAATDTDVAEWIDHAVRQYETCRDRLGVLIEWHKSPEFQAE